MNGATHDEADAAAWAQAGHMNKRMGVWAGL